jgi:hypothetical protein
VRTQAELHAAYPGRSSDEIARLLIERAILNSGRVGIGAGVLGTSEYFAPWTLRGVPAQLMAESLAVAIIEVRLTAELHALHGIEAVGSIRDRAGFWVTAWARGSAHDPHGSRDYTAAMRKMVAVQARRRLVTRARRNLLTMAPLFAGAALGRWINRKQTREFALTMHASLQSARLKTVSVQSPR